MVYGKDQQVVKRFTMSNKIYFNGLVNKWGTLLFQ